MKRNHLIQILSFVAFINWAYSQNVIVSPTLKAMLIKNSYNGGAGGDTLFGSQTQISSSSNSSYTMGSHYKIGNTGTGSKHGVNVDFINNTNNIYIGYKSSNPIVGSGPHYGYYSELSGGGSGVRYAMYNEIGSGTGTQYGIFNRHVGSSSFRYGVYNDFDLSNAQPSFGVRNNFITSNGSRYGLFNNFTGATVSPEYGTYSEFSSTGSSLKYGSYNNFTGGTSTAEIGTYSTFSANTSGHKRGSEVNIPIGNGNHHGAIHYFGSPGNGQKIGVENQINSAGTGDQMGLKNIFTSVGDSRQYAIYNEIIGGGSKAKFGVYSLLGGTLDNDSLYGALIKITNTKNGAHTGTQNELSSNGTGAHIGTRNLLSGIGSGNQFAVLNQITNNGNNNQYGIRNELTGLGTGFKYGTYNELDNPTATGAYGTFNHLTLSTTNIGYGSFNGVEHFGSGTQIAEYNFASHYGMGTNTGIKNELHSFNSGDTRAIDNTIDTEPSSGTIYGMKTNIFGIGGGTKYGTHTVITNEGGGQHVAGYFEADGGANDYAAIFQSGNVVMNEAGNANSNLRVESNNYDNMLFVDAGLNRIGIRSGVPQDVVHINSSISENPFRIEVAGLPKFRVFADGDVYFADEVGFGKLNPTFRIDLENSTVDSLGKGRANAWDVYSDARVKRNVIDISYGLSEILKLRPVAYNHHSSHFDQGELYINDDHENTIGFIAQEVHDVIKEIVSVPADESKDLWSMNYEKLTPVLVKAIQEQQAMIEKLVKQNAKNESELEQLKVDVKELMLMQKN